MCGWLLVSCLAAVAATGPVVLDDSADALGLRPTLRPSGLQGPPPSVQAVGAAADDLSGPAAAAVFRLFSPTARHLAPRPIHDARVYATPRSVLPERGPPRLR
jgi:hypothetical protein